MTPSEVESTSIQKPPLLIRTPFGEGVVTLDSLSGEEGLSIPYHYRLDLLSERDDLDFSEIVGKGVAVLLPFPGEAEETIHGIVSRFVHRGTGATHTSYYADLRPEFWLLTLSSNCRVFQNKTTEQIVDTVFQEAGIEGARKNLTGAYKAREFCVQYQETNFDFISRLLEEEGIFYYFLHEEGRHTMVLADNAGAYVETAGTRILDVREAQGSWTDAASVSDCTVEEQAVPEKYKTGDYNFELPDTDLVSTIGAVGSPREIYYYPGDGLTLDDLDGKAKRMLEALSVPRRILRGVSGSRELRAGARFTLRGHRREQVNGEYVVRRLSSRADRGKPFTRSFEALPVDVPFRPPRVTPRPRIQGAQTATVVGKAGDKVMADNYGRIRVHFHWDRTGKRNESDSCPVRVSQVWAGKQWGTLFLPRIGQEVIVSFLDGNPDRPIVTGSVYNGGIPAPYDPSSEETVSAIRTSSFKGEGFNEIRFDDKEDAEEFSLHAHKDFKIAALNDLIEEIGNDRTVTVKNQHTLTVQKADESLVVEEGNRSITVAKGNESHEVKGTREVTVEGAETHTAKADFTLQVEGNFTLSVKGNITIQTDDGSITIHGSSIENAAKRDMAIKAESIQTEAGKTMVSKAGTTNTVEAGNSVEIKGGVIHLN